MRIWISIRSQTLELFDDLDLIRRYLVSTAKNGAGEQKGSFRTPRGRHIVRAKIGAGAPENAIFVGRRPTGDIWTPKLAAAFPDRDWILTRILWLSGTEPGFNRLGDVDTMRRHVYLHGSPDSAPMGIPGSIGCVRMRNRDIIELFDLVAPYTPVNIVEYGLEAGGWDDLAQHASRIRAAVFVDEQGVPAEMELDEHDPASLHVLARGPSGEPIGTGRLLSDGHIGRLAVLPEWRQKGVGTALMARMVEQARRQGMQRVVLNAQTMAVDFYRRLGFSGKGEEFMEAGIPHLTMARELTA